MSSSQVNVSLSRSKVERTEQVVGLIRAMSPLERVNCFQILECIWSAQVYEEKRQLEVEEFDAVSEYDGDDEDAESEVGNDTLVCYYDESLPLLTEVSLDEINELVKDVIEVEFDDFELEPLVLPITVVAIEEPVVEESINEEPTIIEESTVVEESATEKSTVEVVTASAPAPIAEVVTPVVTTVTKPVAKRTSIVPPKASNRASSFKLSIVTPSNTIKPPTTRANRMSLAPKVAPKVTPTVKAAVPTKAARAPLRSIAVPNSKSTRASVLPPVVVAPKVKTTLKNRVSLAPGTRAERFANVNTHTGPVF